MGEFSKIKRVFWDGVCFGNFIWGGGFISDFILGVYKGIYVIRTLPKMNPRQFYFWRVCGFKIKALLMSSFKVKTFI